MDAGSEPELRVLRQGSAARFPRGDDLHVRVHVLRGLRQQRLCRRLSELRRRVLSEAGQAGDETAEISGFDPAGAARRLRGAARERHLDPMIFDRKGLRMLPAAMKKAALSAILLAAAVLPA